MNKVLLRFKNISDDSIFEAVFDTRISFEENFKLLREIMDLKMDIHYIFDEEKKVALRKDEKLSSFNFPKFMTLLIA